MKDITFGDLTFPKFDEHVISRTDDNTLISSDKKKEYKKIIKDIILNHEKIYHVKEPDNYKDKLYLTYNRFILVLLPNNSIITTCMVLKKKYINVVEYFEYMNKERIKPPHFMSFEEVKDGKYKDFIKRIQQQVEKL